MSSWVRLEPAPPAPAYRLSQHARQRMEEMGLAVSDVNAMLAEPHIDRPAGASAGSTGEGRRVLQGETPSGRRIAAVVDERALVVTVLPWVQEVFARPESGRGEGRPSVL